MTRDEQVLICQKCVNFKIEGTDGVVCKITDGVREFDAMCPDYLLNANPILAPADDVRALSRDELSAALSPDLFRLLLSEQSLVGGLIGGLIVAVAGALIWGAFTVITGYKFVYIAIAIGIGVGFAVRKFGKGIDITYRIIGAALAMFGCVLGNFFSIIGIIANHEGLGYFETLAVLDFIDITDLMTATFQFMDVVFYAFALYQGYRFAGRVVTQSDVNTLNGA